MAPQDACKTAFNVKDILNLLERLLDLKLPRPLSRELIPENTNEYPITQNPNPATISTTRNIPGPADSYTKCLKIPAIVKYATVIVEDNDSPLKGQNNLLIIPTSVDLNESNLYVQEILSISPKSENFISLEKTLHSNTTTENVIFY
ncbi:unnamed protein product [Euphydryas editha]|uniref:Uncharacterized protein n=1 Tax=Euphydryas editha TaxID=104508 RepID=A0AAU9UJQ4_EUPED|nr:unnamed protein product [Euphydryas editha]